MMVSVLHCLFLKTLKCKRKKNEAEVEKQFSLRIQVFLPEINMLKRVLRQPHIFQLIFSSSY